MGVEPRRTGVQLDPFKHPGYPFPDLGRCMGAGDDERLGDDVTDAHARAERALRVLEHRLNRRTIGADFRARERRQ